MSFTLFCTASSIGAALVVAIAQWLGKPTWGRSILSVIAMLYAALTWYCGRVFSYTLIDSPFWFMAYVPILFSLGPFLYIYFCHIGLNRPIQNKKNIKHIIPIILGIVIYTPFLSLSMSAKKNKILELYTSVPFWPYGLLSLICGIVILGYLLGIISKQPNLFRLDTPVKNKLFKGFSVFQIGLIATLMLSLLSSTTLVWALEWGTSLFGLIFIFIVAIQLRHPEWVAAWVGEVAAQYESRDYLAGLEIPEAIAKINSTAAEIYSDPELSLQKFAEETGLNKYQISQLLNQHLNLKFNQFLAEYRIPAAEEQLRTLAWKTTLAIAMDVGYNSYATFCAHFKAKTGMSPQAYRKKYGESTQTNPSL
jgi:AraC-like DNA-binding protein